eukprot:CAMPEP_0194076560 /NCGR_PEP_ID=MMETSP0149-20130528/3340_1 /TAXON_ID=122233 /ORGANISM="Chaetoceros debilis, Strain MM31A-1" /LENGTH=1005 /DNA_ID=CAMNT_0038757339 /DNA_START=153 /DNA_END=3170 /DNA_ORIENTATION=-
MAKKKKKSKGTPVKSPQARSASLLKSQKDEEIEETQLKHSAIVLNISRGSNLKAQRPLSTTNDRSVYINESDARGFAANHGEEVLILKIKASATSTNVTKSSGGRFHVAWDPQSLTDETFIPQFASICQVNIVSDQNKISSPSKNNSKLPREGQVKLLPSALSQRILACDEQVGDSKPSTALSPLLNPPSNESKEDNDNVTTALKTPSSGGQFTFESFVSSPQNKRTPLKNSLKGTPQSNSKFNSHKQSQVAILSLERGQEAFQILARDDGIFTLKLMESSPSYFDTTVLKGSINILNKMVMSMCYGKYFTKDDTIIVSFQGKKLEFAIDEVIKESQSVHSITHSLKNMNIGMQDTKIDGSIDPHETAALIIEELKEKVKNPLLYRVGRNSTFKFIFTQRKDDNENNFSSLTLKVDEGLSVPGTVHTKVVAGLDDIRRKIHSILIPSLFYPERFPRAGPRAPKGLLLHGSNGCGKTVMSSQIELDIKYRSEVEMRSTPRVVDIVRVNCASIQSSIAVIGDAERKLTRIFERAERKAFNDGISTLIVLDDVHLICPRRGAAGDGSGMERVASTLLALMDGIGRHELIPKEIQRIHHGNIAVLAISANPSLLDPALRRAGRLDAEVEVPSPDDKAKFEIFSLCLDYLKREDIVVPSLSEAQLINLARLAKGFTGADCTLCIKEAMRGALTRENGKFHLTEDDIRLAIKATKPSSIKSVTVEIPHVPWSSIGGMTDVKRQLREAIELPLTHSHLFTALRIPPPRGVLLYGPPGCSKTLMARALATEGNMNFLAVKGPELLSKWLGESERALAALFRRARLASPCVIFFDEIDAIASKRGSGESSGGERMLSQLLTELDGVTMAGGAKFGDDGSKQPRVVVVGATNRPDILDSALTRPGRIDRMIYVGLPDEMTRKDILKLQLNGKACSPDIDISELASACEGYSGAEIVSICRESALFAIEEFDQNESDVDPFIRMEHVLRSIRGMKKQITSSMLAFYDSYGNKVTAA